MYLNDEADVEVYAVPPLGEDFPQAQPEVTIPPLDNSNELIPEKLASEQAVYAVGAYPTENILEDFVNAQRELQEQGSSTLVDNAKARWKTEQDEANKYAIASILSDTTMPREEKLNILSMYTAGGFVSPSLKDKFVQRLATDDASESQSIREAHELVVNNLSKRREQSITEELKDSAKSFMDTAKSFAVGETAVAADLINQIPAGLANVFKTIWENDYQKGEQFAKEVNKNLDSFRYDTKAKSKFWNTFNQDPKAKKVYEETLGVLEKIGVPFKWVEDKLYEWTKSPRWATIGEMATEGIVGGVALSTVKVIKGVPKVKPNSPADTMVDANPQVAGEMFDSAIKSPNEQLAKALGTDKGTLLHDTALPKLEQVLKDYPDLHAKMINEMDVKADYSFNLLKYDPNIVKVVEREADLDLILNVAKEQTPFYQQTNSVLTNPGQGVYEGKMVFGKNADYPFTTIEEASEAAKTIQASINKLPDEFNPTVEIVRQPDGIKVVASWKKEYDELGALLFGPDAVKTTILGGVVDVSKFAKSMVGPWFNTRGVFDPKYEASQARSITRSAKQVADLLQVVAPISKTSFPIELKKVIDEMESKGKDVLSRQELKGLFGDSLSEAQYKSLYTDMVYYRRATHYIHRIRNFVERDKLSSQGYKSIYDENGQWVSNVNPQVKRDILNDAKTLYDMDSGEFRPKGEVIERNGELFDKQTGRQVVSIPRENLGTNYGNIALVPSKTTLGALTATVVPRIPGWAPRIYKDHWFVDAVPKKATLNGVEVTNKGKLSDYKNALASARNKYEADAILKELNATGKYGDFNLQVRRERADQYQPMELDYSLSAEAYAHSRKRGETAVRNSTIEDPLVALVKTAQATARANTKYALDEATRKSWIKEYGDMTNGEFPTSIAQIKAGARGQPEERVKAAVAVWNNNARFNDFSYSLNEGWKSLLHSVADVFEGIKIPGALLRDLSRKEIPLVAIPKRVATALWISLNPQRQWLVQPQHAFEFAVLSGTKAPYYVARMQRHFASFIGETPIFKGVTGKALSYLAKPKEALDRKEFDLEAKALRDAGVIESVDTNALVHSVFTDLSEPLVPTAQERFMKGLSMGTGATIANRVTRVGRQIGYDKGELLNQIGSWLYAKDKWIEQNPGKNWNTPENKEFIANAAFNLSGNMNKAGNLPYQEGLFSPILQFQAIGHKNFMTILQDNATILSGADRAKLAAFRALWLGGKYGLPGGGTIFTAAEWAGVPAEDRQVFESGLSDYLVNQFWGMLLGEETSGAVSRSFAAYGQETGLPYGDAFLEFYKLWNSNPSDNPRFPLNGVTNAFSRLTDRLDTIMHKDDIDTKEKWLEGLNEGLKITSGWSNALKGAFILANENKLNSTGSSLDIKLSTGDAIMQAWGITSQKEIDAYKMQAYLHEPQAIVRELADHIYKQINIDQSVNAPDEAFLSYGRMITGMAKRLCDKESPVCTPEMYNDVVEEVINKASKDKGLKDNIIRRMIENGKYESSKAIQEAFALGEKYEEFKPVVDAMKKGNP
jgi:hypothetical protein